MTDNEIISKISNAAFEVRKNLAPGYLESVYKNALFIELRKSGLKVETEVPINVNYKGRIIGVFRVDILVEDKIIIELKAVNTLLKAHELQLINYLQTTGIENGILINYGSDKYYFRIKKRIYTSE